MKSSRGVSLWSLRRGQLLVHATYQKVYREKSDLWATLSDFGPPCFPATWPAKVCHHGSIFLLPRQVAQNRTKLCGPPIWLLFTRLQVSNWVNFVLWIFCIFYWTRKHFFLIFYSCDFPNKLITNLSTIKQKGKIGFFTVFYKTKKPARCTPNHRFCLQFTRKDQKKISRWARPKKP